MQADFSETGDFSKEAIYSRCVPTRDVQNSFMKQIWY